MCYSAACAPLSAKIYPDLNRLVKPLRLGLATVASDTEADLSRGSKIGCKIALGSCDAKLASLLALLGSKPSIGMRLPLLHTTDTRTCMMHRMCFMGAEA